MSGSPVAGVTYVTSGAVSNTSLPGVVYYQATGGGTFAGGVYVNTGNGPQTVLVESTLAGSPTTVDVGAGQRLVRVLDSGPGPRRAQRSGGAAGPERRHRHEQSGDRRCRQSDRQHRLCHRQCPFRNEFSERHLLSDGWGGSFSGLVLSLGSGNNTINIQSKINPMPYTIYGGGGNDVFNIQAVATSGFGNLLLDGGAGGSTLNVLAPSSSAALLNQSTLPGAGVVDATFLGGLQSLINYQNMQTVNLGGNSGMNFINAVYNKVLHRVPSQAELSSWETTLQGPNGLQAVVVGIVQSQESEMLAIKAWFENYLGQEPASSDYTYWLGELSKGADVALSELLASDAYYNKAGGTPTGYVQQLYQDLLGQAPDSVTLVNTVKLLQSLGRQSVAEKIITSGAFEQVMAEADYLAILGRAGSATELSGWATSTDDQFTMEEQFLMTPEFAQSISGSGTGIGTQSS